MFCITNEKIKNILSEELNPLKVEIRMEQSATNYRMKKRCPKKYSIEMDFDNNFNEDIWLHECMHIVQFENGYPKLDKNSNTTATQYRLLISIQNLVLDTMLNRYLKEKYNYIAPINDNKYKWYSNQIKFISKKAIKAEFIKLLAVESAYIYFNDNEENAEDLINQVDSKYGRKSKELYLQILELFSKYSGNNADMCRKIFEEISSLFGLEKSSRII